MIWPPPSRKTKEEEKEYEERLSKEDEEDEEGEIGRWDYSEAETEYYINFLERKIKRLLKKTKNLKLRTKIFFRQI